MELLNAMYKFRGKTVLICLMAFLSAILQTVIPTDLWFLCVLGKYNFLPSGISKSLMPRAFLKAVFHLPCDNQYTFSLAIFFLKGSKHRLPHLCYAAFLQAEAAVVTALYFKFQNPRILSPAFSSCTATQLCISPELCPLTSYFFLGFSYSYSLLTARYGQLRSCSVMLIAGTPR